MQQHRTSRVLIAGLAALTLIATACAPTGGGGQTTGTTAPDEEAGTEAEAVAAVEYLLSLGADVNTVDQNGETAMHGAAYKSLPKLVQFLADKGAKIEVWNRKNKYGWTCMADSFSIRY